MPFLAGRPQFDSVHHQNRRFSSHSYSHESVIVFVFFVLILFKLRRVCFFEFKMHVATAPAAVANKEMRASPLYYDRGQRAAHSAVLWDAENIICNRGRSVASWTLYG